ncbi:MAG TPA: dienelactone hydrolase family protein [Gemmatimonadales bacterium]|nr:dienelactone hydrolase family protein [Gemmatimonadales bacterium]
MSTHDHDGWHPLGVADGTTMRAWVARPAGPGPHPGLLVLQEAFGVNAHIRDVAGRFAAEGFLAIAPELFHRTAPGFEGDYGNFNGVRTHVNALTTEGIEADLRAAFGWLDSTGAVDAARVAAVGYCMGGRCAWIANSALPLAAAVSYYGGGIAPALLDRAARVSGPQLLVWGGRDTHILPEHSRAVEDALRAARKRYASIVFSQAPHGFFCDARPEYDPPAAREAWALTLAFLRDYTGGSAA